MHHWNNQPWQRNLNKTASGKTGAVQLFILPRKVTVLGRNHVRATVRAYPATNVQP